MHDPDLTSQIAKIGQSLHHIEAQLAEASRHREMQGAALSSLSERLVRVEMKTAKLEQLDAAVTRNTITTAVEEAMRATNEQMTARLSESVEANTLRAAIEEAISMDRERVAADIRRTITVGAGVAGTLISGTVAVIQWMV